MKGQRISALLICKVLKDMMPGKNAPPMHTRCRCSTSAYEDSADYEAWLDYLDKGGTTEDWNRLKKQRESRIVEPEDKGDLYTDFADTSDNLVETSLQVNNLLNTLNLPESKWSGITAVKSTEEMGTSTGKKKRNCDIWLRENAPIKSIIHEHLHARSISRTPSAFGKHRNMEEATVELLAEEICKKNNIFYKPTYRKITDALRNIADLLGENDHYEFACKLIRVETPKRREYLINMAEKFKNEGKIKSLVKLNAFKKEMDVLSIRNKQ